MEPAESRRRFEAARVARLATVAGDGRPHVVPITFALDGELIVTAVDHKPKRTTALKRLANIAENPRVSVLVDEYHDDWSRLWWARADGTASVVEPEAQERERLAQLLGARYEQYRAQPPTGPAILIVVERWSGWSATPVRR